MQKFGFHPIFLPFLIQFAVFHPNVSGQSIVHVFTLLQILCNFSFYMILKVWQNICNMLCVIIMLIDRQIQPL